MIKDMYKCEIIADSLSPQGSRLTTYKVTYPRIIHAEFLRHRMLSRNVASSRAIPFKKMVKDVMENPFIPIAWQKNHKGMQGNEYYSKTDKFKLLDFINGLDILFTNAKGIQDTETINLFHKVLSPYTTYEKTLDEWWLFARDRIVESAVILSLFGVTKQLCNRLLEPFVWTTELISGTEWDNFFDLRLPKYKIGNKVYNSKKDCWKAYADGVHLYNIEGKKHLKLLLNCPDSEDTIGWLQINKSQAEIHIQKIAEMMWDAYNDSIPKQLEAGQWHIPFGDQIDYYKLGEATSEYYKSNPNEEVDINKWLFKIATARCARISYETLGDDPKIYYEADIKLHDRLVESNHWSPFEHCAKAMSEDEYEYYGKNLAGNSIGNIPYLEEEGWCNNFRGFIQYRHLIDK